MDVERSMVTMSILNGCIGDLVSRGITSDFFVQDDVRAVYEWASAYSRTYGQTPSLEMLGHEFKDWQRADSTEPLQALADEFLLELDRRYFEAEVMELAELSKDEAAYRAMRGRFSEVLLDKARAHASAIPSGRVGYFNAGLEERIERYEAERGKHRPGIPLSIPVIDDVLQGVRPGWLVTTAGYSGKGKSLISQHCCLSAFEDEKNALILSLEMSSKEIIQRLDTMVMHWRHSDYTRGQLTNTQVERWRDVARVYRPAKGEIVVVDKLGGCSLDRIHAEIERYKPDLVIVDYVQRMRTMYSSKRPRHEQLEEITNDLKTIAMDTDTAVIMVSQDNRASAEQGSTDTNMGSSVSVFQAADVYIGLMQDPMMESQNKMRVRLLKHRDGPKAEVDVRWEPATGHLCDLWRESDGLQRSSLQVPV